MSKILTVLLSLLSFSAMAEQKADEVITGDLNKDGITDKIVITHPRDPEKISVRDDGFEYDFNQPIMSIYFGEADGGFKLFKRYEKLLPYQSDEFLFIENLNIEITPKGILSIAYSTFASAGSYGVPSLKYLFRYQNGDFYLIGKDESEFSRSSGNNISTSINYLTGKKQIVTDNMFDESVKPKERWETIPKGKLQRLGDEEL